MQLRQQTNFAEKALCPHIRLLTCHETLSVGGGKLKISVVWWLLLLFLSFFKFGLFPENCQLNLAGVSLFQERPA